MTNRPFQMPRGWMDHEALSCVREPFDRRSAFAWLIEKANFGPGTVTVKGHAIALEAGELAVSISYLAAAWMWDACRVRRFLNRLSTDTLITLRATRQATHITICNYREIHQPRHTTRHTPKTVADIGVSHNRQQTYKSKYNTVDETRRVGEGVQGERCASAPKPNPDPDQTDLVDWLEENPPPAAPVTLAAEPISTAPPAPDRPALGVNVALAAEPLDTGPPIVTPPRTAVVVPHEAVERRRAARGERGTRWPAGQPVPAEWIGEAFADRKRYGLPEINLDLEAAKFVDFWTGKAGAGGLKRDWQATWRNWARTAKGHGSEQRYDNRRPTPGPSPFSLAAYGLDG